jgi:putative ABC transport system permease protein
LTCLACTRNLDALSHGFWETMFGSDRSTVGTTVQIDSASCSVIGVMPANFEFYPKQTSLWMLITARSPLEANPLRSIVGVFGRLKAGISTAAAQQELAAIHQQTAAQGAAGNWLLGYEPRVYALQEEFTWLAGRNLRETLLVILAAASLILCIACVNVANLLLARGVQRTHQLAVRVALGSGVWRLVRQLLVENGLIGIWGGALGVILALASIRGFRAANPVELPPGTSLVIDWRVLAFASAATLVTILLCSLAPILNLLRFDVNSALKPGSRGGSGSTRHTRMSELLVTSEIAVSLVLMVGAALLLQSIARLDSTPMGFRTDHLLTASIDLPVDGYSQLKRRAAFFDSLGDRLRLDPQISGVAFATGSAIYSPGSLVLSVEGQVAPPPNQIVGDVEETAVSHDYLSVMEVPLFAGRAFDSRDAQSSPDVAIVTQALAQEYFRGENPIGRRIRTGGANSEGPWLTVVGVCGNIKRAIVYKEMGYLEPPIVLRPISQASELQMGVFMRTRTPPDQAAKSLRTAIAVLDPMVPVPESRSIEAVIAANLSQPRFRADLLSGFAVLAALLAAIGVYGVMAHAVGLRTQEMGVRVALGAQQKNILRLILARAAKIALFGVTIGAAVAVAGGRAISGLLYDISPDDPVVFAVAVSLVVTIALLASYIPARRATRVDPIIALRSE